MPKKFKLHILMRYFILLLFISQLAWSQVETPSVSLIPTAKKRGQFYVMWGYTKCAFTKSDIHIVNHSNTYYPETGRYHDYDFTIYDVKAEDKPDFKGIKDPINVTIPQFVGRIGYYFNNKKDFGIEFNYDHAKYVVTDYQLVRVKGEFNGNVLDKDTTLDPVNFLHFEHTDGANFFMLNFIKRWKLYEPSQKFNVGFVAKPGAGIVIPRTDVTMYGTRLNNNWHVAGWIVGVEAGLRMEFLKHGVFEFVGKGAFADYTNALVLGKGNGQANHHFFAGQLTMTLGLIF